MSTEPAAAPMLKSGRCSSILAYLDEVAENHSSSPVFLGGSRTDLRSSVAVNGRSTSPGNGRRRKGRVGQQHRQGQDWRGAFSDDDEKGRQSDGGAKDRGYLHAGSRIRRAPWDSSKSSRFATAAAATARNTTMTAKRASNAQYQAHRESEQGFTAPGAPASRLEDTAFTSSTVDRRHSTTPFTIPHPTDRHRDTGGSIDDDGDIAHSSRSKDINGSGSGSGDEAVASVATESGDRVGRQRRWVWDEWSTSEASSRREKQDIKLHNHAWVCGDGGSSSVKSVADSGKSAASLPSSMVEGGMVAGGDACPAPRGEHATRQAFEEVQATARSMKEYLGRQRSEASAMNANS